MGSFLLVPLSTDQMGAAVDDFGLTFTDLSQGWVVPQASAYLEGLVHQFQE